MHDIEPFYHWRSDYIASEDDRSPFFGRVYDEFRFTQKIYNYYIHPQWDAFGSPTLYMKLLKTDYDEGYAIMELIGEWNDCLTNDIMYLKRDVVDHLAQYGIHKYVVVCENVLNFHGSDDCYYEEWYEDIQDRSGWICFLNLLDHVEEEMRDTQLHHYVNMGGPLNDFNWRPQKPKHIIRVIDQAIGRLQRYLP